MCLYVRLMESGVRGIRHWGVRLGLPSALDASCRDGLCSDIASSAFGRRSVTILPTGQYILDEERRSPRRGGTLLFLQPLLHASPLGEQFTVRSRRLIPDRCSLGRAFGQPQILPRAVIASTASSARWLVWAPCSGVWISRLLCWTARRQVRLFTRRLRESSDWTSAAESGGFSK